MSRSVASDHWSVPTTVDAVSEILLALCPPGYGAARVSAHQVYFWQGEGEAGRAFALNVWSLEEKLGEVLSGITCTILSASHPPDAPRTAVTLACHSKNDLEAYTAIADGIKRTWPPVPTSLSSDTEAPAKRGAGRPRGSYKHQDRADFQKQVRGVVRAYWLAKRKIPSKWTMARALGTDDATLNATFARFGITDIDLARMVDDLQQETED